MSEVSPIAGSVAEPPQISSVAEPGTETLRYHHLDAVRAFALLLGVLFHAAESFGPNNHYWAIVDCSPSQLLEDIRFACHAFRLELFFVIAGFFARLLLYRRGVASFTLNRLSRILVPFVVGWVILYPLLVFIWIWGGTVSPGGADLQLPPEAQGLPAWKLWIGFFITLSFLQKFDLTHLWFLYQLMVLYGLFLCVWAVVRKIDVKGRIMLVVDEWFGRLTGSVWALPWYSLMAFPLLLIMRSWVVDTPKESLIPEIPTTLLFGFCFLVGWLLHRQPTLIQTFRHRWIPHLVLGVVFWLSFGLFDEAAIRRMTPDQIMRVRWLFTLLYALMMWAFVFGFLGLFTRFCQKPSNWSRYLADSSYWIYIAHLPLVVALQVSLGKVPLPWPVKYSLIVLVATVLLFLSYHYLVRGTFIGRVLNGRRYPLVWPWKQGPKP